MARWFMVEDCSADRDIFSIALEQVDGVEPEIFSTGGEVLDRLEAGDVPDVLFLDLDLADVYGTELIALIRELPSTAAVPIVMLSGTTDLDRVDHAYRNGANVFFEKPDSITATTNLFRHILEFWSQAMLPHDASVPTY